MEEIKNYLTTYWEKYPEELLHDPTLEEIEQILSSGVKYFLKEGLFILYRELEDKVIIEIFFFDGENKTKQDIRKSFRANQEFIKKFNKPVYSKYLKNLFVRKYLVKEENNMLRWL